MSPAPAVSTIVVDDKIVSAPNPREINARIHDELFGLVVREDTLPAGPGVNSDEVGEAGPWFGRREPDGSVFGWWQRLECVQTPDYAGDISAAMKVTERMIELGFEVDRFSFNPSSIDKREWQAAFSTKPVKGDRYRLRQLFLDFNESLSFAICVAALRAMEVRR